MTAQPHREMAVVIDFLSGTLETGFTVSLEVYQDRTRLRQINELPKLPPAPELRALYRVWRSRYIALGSTASGSTRTIQPVANQPTHSRSAIQDCRAAAKALESALASWFQTDAFKYLRHQIRTERVLHQDDALPIIFNFRVPEANQLRRLPWQTWDLFRTDLLNAEMVLQAKPVAKSKPPQGPLRVLAIYGSATTGIDTADDRNAWQQVQQSTDITITSMEQPTTAELRYALNQKTWDILFFAGHSTSSLAADSAPGSTAQSSHFSGTLQIGEFPDGSPRVIAVDQLKEDLRRAAKNGLKLAIFNSCDGLGIADMLAQVEVPTTIVMREPVADLVARRFIQEFLQHFSKYKRFYPAVRAARRELDWLENDFYNPLPSATWLPVISHNPNEPPLHWPEPQPQASPRAPGWLRKVLLILGISLLSGVSLLGLIHYMRSTQNEVYGSSLTDPAMSIGSSILTPESPVSGCSELAKSNAAAKMSAGEYETAETEFADFVESCPSDPEAQIYRNNAAVLKTYLPEGVGFSQASIQDLSTFENNVVIVAVAVPLRGDSTYTAQELLRGIAKSQAEHNRRSDGYKIVIEVVNDDTPEDFNLSDQAEKVAKVLAKDPAVFAVVGHYSSGATAEAATIYERAGVVAISPTSTAIRAGREAGDSLEATTIDLGKHIFRVSPDDVANANAIVSDLKKENIQRVLVAYDQGGEYSSSIKAVMEQALEANDVAVEHICNFSQAGGFDPTNCFQSAPNAQALIFLPSAEVRGKAGSLLAANAANLPIWAGDAAYGSSNFKVWGDRINGTRFSIPWHEQSRQNTGSVFGRTEGKSWRSAMAYDALQAIATGATQQARTAAPPNRRALWSILAGENFAADGILGPNSIQFDGGDRELPSSGALTLIVEAVPDGRGGYKTQPVERALD